MKNSQHRVARSSVFFLIAFLISAPVVIVGVPASAAATSCAPPESAAEVQAAVIATVTDKIAAGTRGDGSWRAKYFRYEIDDIEVLHGVVPENLVVESPEQNGINLGLTLDVGTRYGFTFNRFDGNVGGVGVCSVSEPDELRQLPKLVAPDAGAEFFPAPETPLPPSESRSFVGLVAGVAIGAVVIAALGWYLSRPAR